MEALINRIFDIETEEDFNACALDVFMFQYENVAVYREFVDTLGRTTPTHYSEIPFLPIQFFKSHRIIANGLEPKVVFKSSGTGSSIRSSHFVAKKEIYERSFVPTFEKYVDKLDNCIVLALLPSYVEQGESSLVYMVDKLIQLTNHQLSGYYLNNPEELIGAIRQAKETGRKVILFGVSYALLDLAELKPDLQHVLVIETGGMKGRRKEMSKEELHAELISAFNVEFICSEYGMCELLSQSYSQSSGLFDFPLWMKPLIREINDPFSLKETANQTGVVSIIDLANIYSCSFIETQDLGRLENGQLKLMGRVDHSEVRGCNLLVV